MGFNLKKDLKQASELTDETFNSEFSNLMRKHGVAEESLTLEKLREVLAAEIQDLLIDMKRSS